MGKMRAGGGGREGEGEEGGGGPEDEEEDEGGLKSTRRGGRRGLHATIVDKDLILACERLFGRLSVKNFSFSVFHQLIFRRR